jgi:hypothetical protein
MMPGKRFGLYLSIFLPSNARREDALAYFLTLSCRRRGPSSWSGTSLKAQKTQEIKTLPVPVAFTCSVALTIVFKITARLL